MTALVLEHSAARELEQCSVVVNSKLWSSQKAGLDRHPTGQEAGVTKWQQRMNGDEGELYGNAVD